MSDDKLAPEIRRMEELLHTEILGRLLACEHLENEFEQIDDPRVFYGWNLLTQEVLIRLAEASFKLLISCFTCCTSTSLPRRPTV